MDVLIIAHFITEFVKDGTSRFIYIAEELTKRHNVELVTSEFDHTSKKHREKREYNLNTKVTLLKESAYQKNVCIQRFVSHSGFGKEVYEYLKTRKKPDVIYCAVPSLDCAYYAAQYAKKNTVKFIVDVQDLWPEAFKMVLNIPILSDIVFYPMRRKADYIYSCADVIVGVSETYCNRAKRTNKKSAECRSVFLGTKLDSFDKYVKENKVPRDDGKFIIGYCGTLGHSYDIKCVLDAMSIIKEKGQTNVSFWVMGDGPLKEEFEKYASDKDLDAVFYGRVPYPKMCGYLSSCDICINPIVGTSVATIINKHGDYASAGIPVINTQTSAEYRKLIERYACGINCDSSDCNGVAMAILELMNNKELRISMGKQARKMAEELFDRNNSYLDIIKLFE